MGYACPVCGAKEADGEHLANHMAFTAMLRSDEHEDWLDDHVPDWPDRNPETLAPDITPHAPETETEVHENERSRAANETAKRSHGVVTDEGAHPRGLDGELADHGGYGRDSLSGDHQAVLEEARELTRQMYGLDEENSADGAEAGSDGAGESDDAPSAGGSDSDSENE